MDKVRITWDSDNTIMRWDLDQHWTWRDYDTCFWDAKKQGEALGHRYVEIYHFPPRFHIPLRFLTTAKSYLAKAPVAVLMTIMICHDPLTHGMFDMLKRLGELQHLPPRSDYSFKVTHDPLKAYLWGRDALATFEAARVVLPVQAASPKG